LKVFVRGKENSVEFGDNIGELGKSKNDPLLVMGPPPVWFQLVGADGQCFKGSSVDALSLPRSSTIREFCKAIKAEYGDSHLRYCSGHPESLWKRNRFQSRECVERKFNY
jgi:hypothetical protein